MRKKERKTAPPETVLNASENESGQSKLVALSFSILLLVALLIWVFITLWFSGGNFKGAFTGKETLSTIALIGVLLFLLAALYAFSYNNAPEKSRVKVLILIGVVVLISTILCTICADVLNVYAMPISLCGQRRVVADSSYRIYDKNAVFVGSDDESCGVDFLQYDERFRAAVPFVKELYAH